MGAIERAAGASKASLGMNGPFPARLRSPEPVLKWLARNLPRGASLAGGPLDGSRPTEFPEEESRLARASPRRVAEFRSGRRYARQALRHLGRGVAPIPQAPDGAPAWPDGVRGSIAHAGDLAAAAVAPTSTPSFGIDVELDQRAGPEFAALICHALEFESGEVLEGVSDSRLLAQFVAKEAVFKTGLCGSGAAFEPRDIVVRLDWTTGTFTSVWLGQAGRGGGSRISPGPTGAFAVIGGMHAAVATALQ